LDIYGEENSNSGEITYKENTTRKLLDGRNPKPVSIEPPLLSF